MTSHNSDVRAIFCGHDGLSEFGGPSSWLATLLPDLRARGVDARALVFKRSEEDGMLIKSLVRADVPFTTLSHFAPFEERARWVVERVCELRSEVLVPNYFISAYVAGTALHRAGVETVAVLHSIGDGCPEMQRACVGAHPEFVISAAVCVSEVLRQDWARHQPPFPVRRIPCGVPIPNEQAKIAQDTFRLVYVGRLVEKPKRVKAVARAFCRAVREIPGVEACLIGEGEDRAKVEQILEEFGNPPGARLLGSLALEEVRRSLPRYHAIALLSDYEGMPISLMEGMAAGVVPICTAMASGIGEIVHDGQTGIIVKDRDEHFLRAVRQLKESPNLWLKLSRAAREAIDPFSSARCADDWARLIRELAARRPSVPGAPPPGQLEMPRWNPAWAWDFGWDYPRPQSVGARILGKVRHYRARLRARMKEFAGLPGK